MRISTIVLYALLAMNARPMHVPAEAVIVQDCQVKLVDQMEVPAREAGVLVKLDVKEGQTVKPDQILAQIDDLRAQMALRVAQVKLDVAKEEAEDDINVRYSKAAEKVAYAEWEQAEVANQKQAGTVPRAEVRRLVLTHQQAKLQIEKSEMELRIAKRQVEVSQAEVEAAEELVERHKILLSPSWEGMVVKLHRQFGEWVQAGEPVMNIERVNALWVEGYLDASAVSPGEVDGQPVTVKVVLARSRPKEFKGNITYVKPKVEADGTFLVRAKVNNREENGQPLLRAGLDAKMTIELRR